MLPPRKPAKRVMNSRPDRGPLRCPAHLKWVRGFECSIAGRTAAGLREPHSCDGPIEAAHVRKGGDGGMGLKPGDDWVISLCAKAHRIQHQWGETSFAHWYRIDLAALAREFAEKSPHLRKLRSKREVEK